MSRHSLSLTFISIAVIALYAKPTAQVFGVDFFKRLLEDKETYSQLSNEGKTIKSQKLWESAEQFRARHFKPGVWYSPPEGCVGRKGPTYDVELECKLPELQEAGEDGMISELPITFGLDLMHDRNRDRVLEAVQEMGYDRFALSFRVAAKKGFPSNGKTGHVHTIVDGVTLYIDDLKILRRIPFQ